MPLFQPSVPNYEHPEGSTAAGVQSGEGLFGLWPRPVYAGDTRSASSGRSGFLGVGSFFTAPQPAYESPPAALVKAKTKR